MLGYRTIKGLDARQIRLPAEMLTVDIAQISDEERILITRVAHLVVHGLHTAVESVANQLLGVDDAMIQIRSVMKRFPEGATWGLSPAGSLGRRPPSRRGMEVEIGGRWESDRRRGID